MRWWEHLIPNRPMLHRIDDRITTLGADMALNADELKQRIDAATTNIAGDVRGLKDQLDQALAGSDAHAAEAVQNALAGFDTLADRLDNLAADTPEDEVAEEPVDEPEAPADGEQV